MPQLVDSLDSLGDAIPYALALIAVEILGLLKVIALNPLSPSASPSTTTNSRWRLGPQIDD